MKKKIKLKLKKLISFKTSDYFVNLCFRSNVSYNCTKKSYCDFVVWTEHDIHIERIYADEEFWLANVSHVKDFFVTAVLPELLGEFYSRTSQPVIVTDATEPCCSVAMKMATMMWLTCIATVRSQMMVAVIW